MAEALFLVWFYLERKVAAMTDYKDGELFAGGEPRKVLHALPLRPILNTREEFGDESDDPALLLLLGIQSRLNVIWKHSDIHMFSLLEFQLLLLVLFCHGGASLSLSLRVGQLPCQ